MLIVLSSTGQITPNIKFFSLLDFYYSLIKIKIIYDYVTHKCLRNAQILLYTEITCPTSLSMPYTCWEKTTNTTLIPPKTNYSEKNKTKPNSEKQTKESPKQV